MTNLSTLNLINILLPRQACYLLSWSPICSLSKLSDVMLVMLST
jgi:hypothetical protein